VEEQRPGSESGWRSNRHRNVLARYIGWHDRMLCSRGVGVIAALKLAVHL
jgi:hypothetical protein